MRFRDIHVSNVTLKSSERAYLAANVLLSPAALTKTSSSL